MNAGDRSKFIEKFLDEYIHPVMKAKGGEYSRGEEDVNSNFKRVAEGLGLTPEQVCYTYLAKHMDSIANAVKTGEFLGLSEHIFSRIGDAVNYLIILASLVQELRLSDAPTGPEVKLARETRTHDSGHREEVQYHPRAIAQKQREPHHHDDTSYPSSIVPDPDYITEEDARRAQEAPPGREESTDR